MKTNNVKRIFVEKKPGFNIEAQQLLTDLKENLGILGLENLRVINRYDISGISDEEYLQAKKNIFVEPPVDLVYEEELETSSDDRVFAMELLPGQFDQREDSAAQCIQILTQKERPLVASAKVIILNGSITDEEFAKIKDYLINPIESHEVGLEKPEKLEMDNEEPANVEILKGFINKNQEELKEFHNHLGLAMSFEDLEFCQKYFRDEEKRDPSITEILVIDTYWSDHCRHTTFLTRLNDISIVEGTYKQAIEKAFQEYLSSRKFVYEENESNRDISLMDIAVLSTKELKKKGLLDDLDESEEINACSIVVDVDVDDKIEKWLVMFKNETHNHPTEIEPFGGASTCLGGAIRDPLSGRTYVYQAMRITGSGDPRAKIEDTLKGKLPQKVITTQAATGYSSYGNQIGVATGQVSEIYHEDFIAKRMELGAVISAAPYENVVRESPKPGDVVVLVGGRTGRDGCGGATGSSKEHTTESLITCGTDVQKGNPPIERNILRLFRNPKASRMIKKCNDFGAGGVSVAIGELTDGVMVNLDAVPTKYEGLDGTELAISESQERMAVVISAQDFDSFQKYAHEENLEATLVAEVSEIPRLKMTWRGETIVDISREFLNTNGIKQEAKVKVQQPDTANNYFKNLPSNLSEALQQDNPIAKAWLTNLEDINVCSQKGLVDLFDSSIGASTVLMPFGGLYQATPAEGMVAKLPLLSGETNTATIMTYGYNPFLSKWSPFHGALYAVIEAVTKVVALGGDYKKVRLTLQEYFEKLGEDPEKWGKPFSALLGAFYAQKELQIPALGGKDSMSGTFMDLNVPPTLVAFAVNVADARKIISQEFKKHGSNIVLIPAKRNELDLPDFKQLTKNYDKVKELIERGLVLSSSTVRMGGLAAALSKMAFGNRICFSIQYENIEDLFRANYGSIILELKDDVDLSETFSGVEYILLGQTQKDQKLVINNTEISLSEAYDTWAMPLEKIFPTKTEKLGEPKSISYSKRNTHRPSTKIAKPRVFIPVFPGTNGEYDSARIFEKVGAVVETSVIRNLTPADIESSISEIVKHINNAQIVMLPGGSCAGDEPDGSAKFIATMFRNPRLKEAITDLLNNRDGLMLGIGNGFQALVKLGLLPYGEIRDFTEDSPTITRNKIGHHMSCMAQTKVVSILSPWFSEVELGDIHTIAVSHGEGRFVANPDSIRKLIDNGQVATQYVDFTSNGSYEAIEGITSPDGRVLGKMGHSERVGKHVAINIPGNKYQPIFEGGVNYFRD